MLESAILGLIQGVAEWLPVSSEAFIVLARVHLFGHSDELINSIEHALLLHFGTLLAAVIYFSSDIREMLEEFVSDSATSRTRKTIRFLILTTLISGILGFGLLQLISGLEQYVKFTGRGITVLVGLLLLFTGLLQLGTPERGLKSSEDLIDTDSVLLGVAQGLAALPGLSRSGLTVSVLLLRKYDDDESLRLSFLMSIPIVLAGNIILNFGEMVFTIEDLIGVLCAFLSGLLTIHLLIKVARGLSFGYFVFAFGLLTIASTFF